MSRALNGKAKAEAGEVGWGKPLESGFSATVGGCGLTLQAFIEEKRTKGNHGNGKRQKRAAQTPLLCESDGENGEDVNHEQTAMKGAEGADGSGLTEGVFERHGNEHQQNEGKSFGESEKAKTRCGGGSHGGSFARLNGNLDGTVAYGRIGVMRALPFWFGFLLFLDWVASVVSFRLGMTLFADFVIKMPTLTRVAVATTGGFLLVIASCFVAFAVLLLARKKRAGWWLSLAVCAVCNLLCLAWATPVTALINEAISNNPVPFLPNASVILEFVGSFFNSFSKIDFTDPTTVPLYSPFATSGLTLLLFIALIIKRRIWLKPEL